MKAPEAAGEAQCGTAAPSEPKPFSIVITQQWPSVVHKCPGGANGFRVVRFGVCRDGEETVCQHCGKLFRYLKPTNNPADGYQWGAAELSERARR